MRVSLRRVYTGNVVSRSRSSKMNGTELSPLIAGANGAVNFHDARRRESDLNSARIEVVAHKLGMHAVSSGQKDDPRLFFQLCLSLARGIDYGVANHEVPEKASKLPQIFKVVCHRKTESFLQAAVMVLMISVKNACKMGWFTAKDTEELLTLANEVGSSFATVGEINSEVSVRPTLSTIISRFYPQFKLGNIVASLEVKPGYGTYLLDFQMSKNAPYSLDEKIRLFVAMKDSVDTSSCIVSPQKVTLLLNGKAVDKRTTVSMDQGPQFPTAINQQLKYGTNLLQAVGHFNGHYIIAIAFMSIVPPSSLPVPPDYVQPDSITASSELDSEIIEGPSRISLNCPISYKRIGTPVKGHLCKHYQCFDLSNYLELNSKRPSWRCPQCNQSVCFTDLRVDQRMAKVLQEEVENVSEVILSADGSWTTASSKSHKYESNGKASTDQLEQDKHPESLGTDTCKVYDLTEEDNAMEIGDTYEEVDIKPVIHQNLQNQLVPSNISPSPVPISNSENHYSSTLWSNTNSRNFNNRSEFQTGNAVSGFPTGVSPVLTDSASPSLNQLTNSFLGTNYPASSTAQFSASNSSHLVNIPHAQSALSNGFGGFQGIPRNVTRTPTAIQALAVPRPSPQQQYLRPTTHTTNTPSSQFQVPLLSNLQNTHGMSIERQQYIHQAISSAIRASGLPSLPQNHPPQNHLTPRMAGHHSTPNQSANPRMPQLMRQTLSQPPHLRSSSQVPQNHGQQGLSHGGPTRVTMEPIQLTPQHLPQMRHNPQTTPPPLTEPVGMTSQIRPTPTPLPPPQAVSRTENLINLESEQNWRPAGRMRGALTGEAYSAALNRFYGQPNQPTEVTPSPRPLPHLESMPNRMNPQISQVFNHRLPNNASNGSGAPSTQ